MLRASWSLLLVLLVPALSALAVETIDNPDQPSGGHQDLELEELWRIGGLDDEENILGVIAGALADDQGQTYLLDLQLVQVQVFDEDGIFVRKLGQAGEGPGEIRRPGGMVFMPDGSLGLLQAFPGKVVKLQRDGSPAGEFHPGGDDPSAGGFFALQGARSRGGHLAFSGARMVRGEGRMTANLFIAAFGEDGSETTRYFDQERVREFRGQDFSEKDEFFPHQGWALGEDGRAYIPESRNDYAISVYRPDGTLERIIRRPFESYRRNDAELARARDEVMPWRRRNRGAMNIVVEPTDQDIRDMHVAPDGRLWVLSSRGIHDQPAGVHSTWDVFTPTGHWEKTVSLRCEGRSPEDRIFFAGADKVVLVRRFDGAMKAFRGSAGGPGDQEEEILDVEPLEVIVYRMTP